MRKHLIPVALFAALATMAVSCQKEDVMVISPETTISEAAPVHTVQYTVNGVLHSIVINSDEEWDAFMQTVFALSREGYEVNIMDENRPSTSFTAKETQVFTTSIESEASAWSKDKVYNGYQVTVLFDQGTGQYICIATR